MLFIFFINIFIFQFSIGSESRFHHLCLAQRRRFSSPETLILNRLLVAQQKQQENNGMLIKFAMVQNVEATVQKLNELIDHEICQNRAKMLDQCKIFENDVNELQVMSKVATILWVMAYHLKLTNLSFNEAREIHFQRLCHDVQKFKNEYLDLFLFDKSFSVELSRITLNTEILKKMHMYAERYNFSQKNIPSNVFLVQSHS